MTEVGVDADGHPPYPTIAMTAAEMVADGKVDCALPICGTGVSVTMFANKVPGTRASVAHASYAVERLIMSNNAQVFTFGQRVFRVELARRLVSEWITYRFDERPASQKKYRFCKITRSPNLPNIRP